MPSSESFPGIDARAARRRFERAARTYAGASRLESEVAARMLERLDLVKLAPARILDAGSGPGRDAAALIARFPKAELIALDLSLAMLRSGKKRFFEKRKFVCADLGRLPLAAGSLDFIWSNMALHWAADVLQAIRELSRVSAPGGLIMFSTLGPDTLKELRAVAGASRVHQFVDMHDLGDMLVEVGFSAPVMDMELLTMTYPEAPTLLADLRASGQTSARPDRARGLAGKVFLEKLRRNLPGQATFEVVYGHAWKAAPRKVADGRDIVQFHRRT